MTKLTIIGCDRSAGEALRSQQESGYVLPEGVAFRPLPCGGSLDIMHILGVIESGADCVLVLSCFSEACRSFNGQAWAEKRTSAVQALLQEASLDQTRVIFRQVSPTMAADLASWINELVNTEPSVAALGQA